MKKLFYFALAGLLALGIQSCKDDKNEGPSASLSATPPTLTFKAVPEGPQEVAVKASNVSWKATTDAKWLTLKDTIGTADGKITVTAGVNETTEPQNATITIKAAGVKDVTIAVTQNPGQYLAATPDTLTFAADPEGPLTIAVEADNVSWKATTEAGWLTLENAEGTADGTITVTAGPNETQQQQNATIVLKADGVDDVTVVVIQAPADAPEPAIIWDRSSLSRMNFSGKVKTASTFGMFTDNSLTSINDLTFDANGMLKSFTRQVGSQTLPYALSYDGDNRLTKCEWTNQYNENVSFEITYGTHNQYVYPESVFNDISFSMGVLDFIVWMPRYIKNMETVVCKFPNSGDPSKTDVLTYSVEVTGSTGKVYVQSGDDPKEDYLDIKFTDRFMTEGVSGGWFGSTTTYEVNAENGNLVQYIADYGDGTVTSKFNNDRINSQSEVIGDISTKLTYFENLNVKTVTDPKDNSSSSMTYEYDAQGNWTKMTVTGAETEEIERTVTYF